MSVKIDLNKFKGAKAEEKLAAQASAPRQSEGESNGGYGILDYSKAPYELKNWKPKKGDNLVMILPVEVTSDNNPAFRSGAIDKGEFDYGLSIYTHMGKDTVAGLSHVCLKRNYGKFCPRCEEFFLPPEKGGTYVKGVQGSGNKAHASSERNYFLVVPYNGDTPDTENMGIWNSPADKNRGFAVVERAKDMADGTPIIPFWWPTEEGRLVSFRMVQDNPKDFPTYDKIRFVKRDAKVALGLAEKYSFPLDSLLIVKAADQINADIFGGPGSEDTREDHDTHDTQEPEEAGMDPDAFGAPEPEAPASPVEAEEPEHKETPAPAKAPASTGSKCPYGHKFGEDWSGTPDCKLCKRDNKATEASCADQG